LFIVCFDKVYFAEFSYHCWLWRSWRKVYESLSFPLPMGACWNFLNQALLDQRGSVYGGTIQPGC